MKTFFRLLQGFAALFLASFLWQKIPYQVFSTDKMVRHSHAEPGISYKVTQPFSAFSAVLFPQFGKEKLNFGGNFNSKTALTPANRCYDERTGRTAI